MQNSHSLKLATKLVRMQPVITFLKQFKRFCTRNKHKTNHGCHGSLTTSFETNFCFRNLVLFWEKVLFFVVFDICFTLNSKTKTKLN